ncbi:MAG: HD family phosphohydrolase [Clostridium sp.]|uniref:HD family phosphohydrolase n=2 Tax=Clostridium sp. TaxID=1506 RepID=UPI002FC7AF8F
MFYRVGQFFKAIFSKLTDEDRGFINKYLLPSDRDIFNKLPTHEKKHSINVARYVMENNNVDDNIIRATLLHDVGKINSGLNPFFKGAIVIMDGISPSITKKLNFIKPVRVYYNHPSIGGKIYRDRDEFVAFIIENHHNPKCCDPIVTMVREADCKN